VRKNGESVKFVPEELKGNINI